MKYPIEKRRPSTHHERLHREIGLILQTRYNDPHSGAPNVDTNAEADAWYNMLSEDDRKWVIELFNAEIHSEEQSDRDRGYLLDVLCRWDCDLAAEICLSLWKNLPVETNLQLQKEIASCRCFPYGKDTEIFLLHRFAYWEKKLFLEAERMEWDELAAAKEVVMAIANVIALNSFHTGFNIYPRCTILAHRGVFDDIQFLSFLTHTVPIATMRSYPSVSETNLGELSRYLMSSDPRYVEHLKRQQKQYSCLGEPLNSLICNLKPYQRRRPTTKLKAEVLTQLRRVGLEHDQLQVNSDGEFELVMTKALKSRREQIEMEIPFMSMGTQVLARELLASTAGKLVNVLSNCHITELAAINPEDNNMIDFVIRFEISKA